MDVDEERRGVGVSRGGDLGRALVCVHDSTENNVLVVGRDRGRGDRSNTDTKDGESVVAPQVRSDGVKRGRETSGPVRKGSGGGPPTSSSSFPTNFNQVFFSPPLLT